MKVLEKIKKPLIFTLLGLLAISYYIYLSHRNVDNTEKIPDKSPATELISRDLELNYPKSPKEVVTYYCDIIKIIYKEKLSDDEITGLAQHLRGIYDDELLSLHPYESYLSDLKAEIESYKNADKFVNSYDVKTKGDIILFKEQEYRKVDVLFFEREGSNLVKLYEEFTLRKDEDGNWKILYWEQTDASSME